MNDFDAVGFLAVLGLIVVSVAVAAVVAVLVAVKALLTAITDYINSV